MHILHFIVECHSIFHFCFTDSHANAHDTEWQLLIIQRL
uniref:Uncharacterized protein n=1 Tax=Anguilla anguilla TaxID=7936 RepID=A0A0E9TI03_ANGAN